MNLIDNPHKNLKSPENSSVYLVKGCLKYYHYVCDGFDDRGWGCGYRTLQTILSWLERQKEIVGDPYCPCVPSIIDTQKALVEINDKHKSFIGSTEWIGSIEVAYCIEFFYKIQSKVIHARNVNDLKEHTDELIKHFIEYGSPIMMGGDEDSSSKCILGISINQQQISLLILDPHYSGPNISREELQSNGWIKWQSMDSLNPSSFYNLCCPLLKAKH